MFQQHARPTCPSPRLAASHGISARQQHNTARACCSSGVSLPAPPLCALGPLSSAPPPSALAAAAAAALSTSLRCMSAWRAGSRGGMVPVPALPRAGAGAGAGLRLALRGRSREPAPVLAAAASGVASEGAGPLGPLSWSAVGPTGFACTSCTPWAPLTAVLGRFCED
jgi:hypothetical protein